MGAARPTTSPPGTLTDVSSESAALRPRRRRSSSTSRPDPSTARRIRSLVVHDGGDYLRYAAAGTVLDNLDPRRRRSRRSSPRSSSPASGSSSTPTTRATPTYLTDGAGAPAGGRLRLAGRAAGALPRRRQLRRRRLACRRRSPRPATSAACCSSRARSPVPARAAGRAPSRCGDRSGGSSPGSSPDPSAVAERVFVSCGAYESLICENRAPRSRARPARAWTSASSSPSTGTTGPAGATASASACPGCFGDDGVAFRPWPTSPAASGSPSAPTCAGRSATRRSSAASTWRCRSAATPCASTSTG